MLQTKRLILTADDYRLMPETGRRYQLIDGEMHMSPSPNRFHQRIVTNLVVMLSAYVNAHPIGEVYVSPLDVYLSDIDVYQPDVVFISRERASIQMDEGLHGAPDLVCEVLSPSTSHIDLGTKREVYARSGVLEMWAVDPDAKEVRVYRLQENALSPTATYRRTDQFESACLPGLRIDVARIFKD